MCPEELPQSPAPDSSAPDAPEPQPPVFGAPSDPSAPELPFGVPTPEAVAMVGVGEMPIGFYRFNWGAFLMPGVWGIVYGVWPLIGLWVASLIVPLAVASLIAGPGSSGDSTLSVLLGVTVVSETFVGIVRLWVGMNANRLLWSRERRRLELAPGAPARIPLVRFLRRQRAWAVWGVVLLLPAFAINGPLAVAEWRKYGLGPIGAAEPFVWLVAEVALGLWLAYRMRVEGPDPAPAAGRA